MDVVVVVVDVVVVVVDVVVVVVVVVVVLLVVAVVVVVLVVAVFGVVEAVVGAVVPFAVVLVEDTLALDATEEWTSVEASADVVMDSVVGEGVEVVVKGIANLSDTGKVGATRLNPIL